MKSLTLPNLSKKSLYEQRNSTALFIPIKAPWIQGFSVRFFISFRVYYGRVDLNV